MVLLCYCNILKTTVAAHLGQDAYEKKKKKRFIISESLFSGKVFFCLPGQQVIYKLDMLLSYFFQEWHLTASLTQLE